MMHSKRIGDELYVYHNGVLVYKRWYKPGTNQKIEQPSRLFNREIGWPDQEVR